MANIIRLNRKVSPGVGTQPPASTPPDLYEVLSKAGYRMTLFERVADALGSRDFLLVYVGFVIGCFATVGLAFVWSALS